MNVKEIQDCLLEMLAAYNNYMPIGDRGSSREWDLMRAPCEKLAQAIVGGSESTPAPKPKFKNKWRMVDRLTGINNDMIVWCWFDLESAQPFRCLFAASNTPSSRIDQSLGEDAIDVMRRGTLSRPAMISVLECYLELMNNR